MDIRRAFRGAAAWGAIAIAAGCTTSPAALSNRAVEFNKTAASAADSQILLNVLRSAFREPVRYTAISQIRESRTLDRGIATGSSLPFGADAPRIFNLSPSASLRSSETPSFDVIPLDTKAAASGLFRPVETQTFVTFWNQRWPRGILLSLFVDTITLNPAASRICGFPPRETSIANTAFIERTSAGAVKDSFARAQQAVRCLRTHLRVVETSETISPLNNVSLDPAELVKALPELSKAGFSVKQSAEGVPVYTVSKQKQNYRIYFDPMGKGGQASVRLTFRSADGMIYYLGEIVRRQLAREPVQQIVVGGREPDVGFATLFHVYPNPGPETGETIDVDFLGGRYGLQRNPPDSDRSLTVMSIVSQVFSLYKESSDLPRTSAVQVVGAP